MGHRIEQPTTHRIDYGDKVVGIGLQLRSPSVVFWSHDHDPIHIMDAAQHKVKRIGFEKGRYRLFKAFLIVYLHSCTNAEPVAPYLACGLYLSKIGIVVEVVHHRVAGVEILMFRKTYLL